MAEFYQERAFTVSKLAPVGFPLQEADLDQLAGADKAANAGTVRRIFAGEERGPVRDAVLLNAGAALFVADRCRSLMEGWDLAEQLIADGSATRKLKELTGK